MAEALPNSKFEIIPNAGHIAFFENPDRVFSLDEQKELIAHGNAERILHLSK